MTSPPTVASYSASTSVLGRNLQSLRDMLSNVAAVQTLFGAANAAEAAERIYLGCLPRPSDGKIYTPTELSQYRPFAIIGPTENVLMRSRLESVGGLWTHGRQGEFDIILERAHPTSGNDDVNDLAWIDTVDLIRQSNDVDNPGLIELHDNGAGYLSLRMVEVIEIWRSDPQEAESAGDYQFARIRVHWGRL